MRTNLLFMRALRGAIHRNIGINGPFYQSFNESESEIKIGAFKKKKKFQKKSREEYLITCSIGYV